MHQPFYRRPMLPAIQHTIRPIIINYLNELGTESNWENKTKEKNVLNIFLLIIIFLYIIIVNIVTNTRRQRCHCFWCITQPCAYAISCLLFIDLFTTHKLLIIAMLRAYVYASRAYLYYIMYVLLVYACKNNNNNNNNITCIVL